MNSLQDYLDEFRELTSSDDWSKAVRAGRTAECGVESTSDNSIVLLRLSTELRAVRVHFSHSSTDYESDCRCDDDPCIHLLVAAIIAKQGERGGPAKTEGVPSIEYSILLSSSSTAPSQASLTGDLIIRRSLRTKNADKDLIAPLAGKLREYQGGVSSGRIKGAMPLVRTEDYIIDTHFDGLHSEVSLRRFSNEAFRALSKLDLKDEQGGSVEVRNGSRKKIIRTNFNPNGGLLLIPQFNYLDQGAQFQDGVLSWSDGLPEDLIKLLKRGSISLDGTPEFVSHGRFKWNPLGVEFIEPEGAWPVVKSVEPALSFLVREIADGCSFRARIRYAGIAELTNKSFRLASTKNLVNRDISLETRLVRTAQRLLRVPFGEDLVVPAQRVSFVLESLKGHAVQSDASEEHSLIGELEFEVLKKEEGIKIGFFASSNGNTAKFSSADIFASYGRGESRISVPGVGWFSIPQRILDAVEILHGDLEASRVTIGGPRPSSSPLASLESATENEDIIPDFKLLGLLQETVELIDSDLNVPDKVSEFVLREYQKDGVRWLLNLRQHGLPGALLADDMGLGKSLQSLLASEFPLLIVAPKSVLGQWRILSKKLFPSLEVKGFSPNDEGSISSTDILVTTYGMLRGHVDSLSRARFSTIIFDEVHHLKNSESQTHLAARQLNSNFFIGLTGTPIENSILDLDSIIRCCVPSLALSMPSTRRIVEKEKGIETLRSLYGNAILRRKKEDVLTELPPRTDIRLDCILESEQLEIYARYLSEAQHFLSKHESDRGGYMQVLEYLLRLRQICVHPQLVSHEFPDVSAKFDVLEEELQRVVESGHKALVFSQWTSALNLFEKRLKGIPFVRIDGSKSTAERDLACKKLIEDDDVKVMLLSLKAGGVGLNLTAADHVFFLDSWWNPAVEAQAADRVYRIGQENPVFIHSTVVVDSVEERLIELQVRKRRLLEDFFEGEQGVSPLSVAEIRELIS